MEGPTTVKVPVGVLYGHSLSVDCLTQARKRASKRKRQSTGDSIVPPRTVRKGPTRTATMRDKAAVRTVTATAASEPSEGTATRGDGDRMVSSNFVYQNLKHRGSSRSNKDVEKMKRKIGGM